MRTGYQRMKEEPRKLNEREEIVAGEFLWENFWLDFHAKRDKINMPLIQANLKRLLYNQGTEVPPDLLRFMKDEDVIRSTTELYAYIQLTCQGIQHQFWPKALEQSNPYVLRYHVFTLHNRMHDLMTKNKNPSHDTWRRECDQLYSDTQKTVPLIERLSIKTPAFAHFLLAYTHYTLAMGATAEHAKAHWKEAYMQFLMTEQTEKKNPKASFIVNLGSDLYRDMPFDNLEPVKAQVCEHLSEQEQSEVRAGLERRMKNSQN